MPHTCEEGKRGNDWNRTKETKRATRLGPHHVDVGRGVGPLVLSLICDSMISDTGVVFRNCESVLAFASFPHGPGAVPLPPLETRLRSVAEKPRQTASSRPQQWGIVIFAYATTGTAASLIPGTLYV